MPSSTLEVQNFYVGCPAPHPGPMPWTREEPSGLVVHTYRPGDKERRAQRPSTARSLSTSAFAVGQSNSGADSSYLCRPATARRADEHQGVGLPTTIVSYVCCHFSFQVEKNCPLSRDFSPDTLNTPSFLSSSPPLPVLFFLPPFLNPSKQNLGKSRPDTSFFFTLPVVQQGKHHHRHHHHHHHHQSIIHLHAAVSLTLGVARTVIKIKNSGRQCKTTSQSNHLPSLLLCQRRKDHSLTPCVQFPNAMPAMYSGYQCCAADSKTAV